MNKLQIYNHLRNEINHINPNNYSFPNTSNAYGLITHELTDDIVSQSEPIAPITIKYYFYIHTLMNFNRDKYAPITYTPGFCHYLALLCNYLKSMYH